MAYTGSVPDIAGRRRDWMARMACRTAKPDLFFDPEREDEARIICIVRCPVRAQCLADVKRLEGGTPEESRQGVVAGLTEHERWRLDASAAGHSQKPALTFTGEPPECGTYTALLRHLWFGERIDPDCWSAEIRRERANSANRATDRRRKQPAPTP